MRRAAGAVGAALVAGAAAGGMLGATGASAGDGVRATLDGEPISLARAATLSCHDFAYPVLTCFRTSAELEGAAAREAAARGGVGDPGSGEPGTPGAAAPGEDDTGAAVAAAGYVVVYEHGAYAGAAASLSQDYAYLGSIGWNDRISSLKSYGAAGRFWEHSPSGGFAYTFGSSTWVSYVGDAYNDRFSALDLD